MLISVGVAVLLLVWTGAWLAATMPASSGFAGLSHLDAVRETTRRTVSVSEGEDGYYPGLSSLATNLSPLRIASTEVGRLSVVNSNFTILDIAGLNNRDVIFSGFSADWLVGQAPDLMYLPHPQYDKTNRELLQNEAFQADYQVYSNEQLHAVLGVAIRRDGPFSTELMKWINAVLQSVQ